MDMAGYNLFPIASVESSTLQGIRQDEANAIRDQLETHGSKMAKPIPEAWGVRKAIFFFGTLGESMAYNSYND